jgi:hypothetical protein
MTVSVSGTSNTRYGRESKTSLSKFTEFDGANVIVWDPEIIMDCDRGNSRICELMKKIKKSIGTTKKSTTVRKDISVNAESGRVRIELKLSEKMNNKIRVKIKSCKDKNELREVLMKEKAWKVTFREQTDEDLVPGNGWCGYLSVNQVLRNADEVQEMDSIGVQQLIETLNEIIRTSRGGVRPNWKSKDIKHLTTREVLFSVKDTLVNWGTRLTDALGAVRWLNAKNIYGTCGIWNYSQWGTDSVDERYCELRDSHLTQGNTTNYEEWQWAIDRKMIIGARNHYYVRNGG